MISLHLQKLGSKSNSIEGKKTVAESKTVMFQF